MELLISLFQGLLDDVNFLLSVEDVPEVDQVLLEEKIKHLEISAIKITTWTPYHPWGKEVMRLEKEKNIFVAPLRDFFKTDIYILQQQLEDLGTSLKKQPIQEIKNQKKILLALKEDLEDSLDLLNIYYNKEYDGFTWAQIDKTLEPERKARDEALKKRGVI